MSKPSLRERIVDTALDLAEQSSWEAVRLHQVAAALGITLDDVRAHFREKEDIVDAWFDRADAAMLREAARIEVAALPMRERLHHTLMAWLAALAAHRRPTRQMVVNKFEPGHVHYQIAGLLRVSRTVQWWREAAGCTARVAATRIRGSGAYGHLSHDVCLLDVRRIGRRAAHGGVFKPPARARRGHGKMVRRTAPETGHNAAERRRTMNRGIYER